MSMPTITPVSQEQAISDLLETIALQEAGLAHIINAEGEKIQAAVRKEGVTIDELLKVNQSVSDVLTKVIKMEMMLEFKLEEVSKITPTTPQAQ
ncbi:hypothetical protein SAMN05660865_00553 [Caloramator fervidus]|uniref:Uncharacterized protein n=1 Tax=Caloramator fervidus TaxID=29344 RepID=A0A1H5T7S1_9CLOT|nr:hypothetical protein [Caloramator fervidus]SEF58840.1 hypothetical protein SAMN05660865_00553 [Caloramator fervidus]